MYKVTGDRSAVLQLLESTVYHLENAPEARGRTGASSTGSVSAGKAQAAPPDSPLGVWQQALGRLEQGVDEKKGLRSAGVTAKHGAAGRGVATPFAPREQQLALFQSAMDEYLETALARAGSEGNETDGTSPVHGPRAASATRSRQKEHEASLDAFFVDKPPAPAQGAGTGTGSARGGTLRPADILAKFGHLDPHWVEVVVEKAKLLLRGKHPFVAHGSPSDFRFRMNDTARVAIVGDWGGGNEAAQAVAKQIAKLAPDHVIHLGDVYYAGTPKEVQERFLRYWPQPKAPGRSFALNSNHEMYSGGYGYFDLTLQKFSQPASYFSLANEHWRFIGLDTGYDEHDLHPPQAEWLGQQLADAGPKTILMSHHQLFSAYENTDASRLRAKVEPLLGDVYGWIWGHEHLAVVYEKHEGINAICLGNGCFPYDFPAQSPSVAVKWIDMRKTDDPDYPGGHTFALLTIDGPHIDMQLIDEKGSVGWTEKWE